MNHLLLFVLCGSAILASCNKEKKFYVFAGPETEALVADGPNYRPKNGYINTPKMAAQIAEILAKKVYGSAEIEDQMPYLVTKNGDEWIIRGSFNHPGSKGGVFEIRLSASDGRVLRMMHGK